MKIFTKNNMTLKTVLLLQFLTLNLTLSFQGCKNNSTENQKQEIAPCTPNSKLSITKAMEEGDFIAHKTKLPVQIDGCPKEAIWAQADWYDMNYLWMGDTVDTSDYHGRFKLAWSRDYLYILVEVIDEKLHPTLSNGVENYWKGDYVEVFVDEDKSGGNHQFNHQAFAYHVSTEGHAIDKNTLKETVFFEDHVKVKRSQNGNHYLWEMAVTLYDKQFDENTTNNIPVKMIPQKRIGFSIAYGDNDGNNTRENFMGSKKTHGKNNDEGYINSDVFGSILFIE